MGHKLLLADDSITIQKVVGIIFSNADYELSVVDNGTAAVEEAKMLVPDVMLIDAIMPGKTGYEVCEEVRRDPTLAHVPVLLLTGVFEPFDEDKAKRAGADDFISKPFESQHLLEKVNSLIRMGNERKSASPHVAPEPVVAAAPVFSDPFAPVQVEEIAEDDAFDIISLSSEHVVSAATAEDDLWGAVDTTVTPDEEPVFGELLEESADEEAVTFNTGILSVEPVRDDVMIDLESPDTGGWDTGETVVFGETLATDDVFAPAAAASGDDIFGAVDAAPADVFAPAVEQPVAEADPFGTIDFSSDDVFGSATEAPAQTIIVEEPAPAAPAAPAVEYDSFFIEEEEVAAPSPVVEIVELAPVPEPPPAAFAAAAPAVAAAPAAAGTVTLSEEQLAEVITKISREIIERIAWEVVPDLAESMIREEIRKITGPRS